jgi:hypothetical protein
MHARLRVFTGILSDRLVLPGRAQDFSHPSC